MALRADLTPYLRGPAEYPPEWRWQKWLRPVGRAAIPALACAVTLIALVPLTATAAARRHPRRAAWLVLVLASLFGYGLDLAALRFAPRGIHNRLRDRTLSANVTSFFTVATWPEARDPRVFLRDHASLLEGYVTSARHAATHPPGPVLYERAVLAFFEACPGLTARLAETPSPHDVEVAHKPHYARPTPVEMVASIVSPLLLPFFCVLTVWPLASLARSAGAEPLAAARLGVLWCLVPGAVLMTPTIDQALALPVTAAIACLAAAMTSERHASTLTVAGGLLGGLALFFSYGAAAFLDVGGIAALALGWGRPDWPRRALLTTAIATAAAAAVFAVPAIFGGHPLAAARTALRIHDVEYTAPRSYALWLLFNPLDLALFLGAPFVVLCAARRRGSDATHRLRLATLAGVAVLLLSGSVRGEIGRIWVPLMPLLLVAALGDHRDHREATVVATLMAALVLAIGLSWGVP